MVTMASPVADKLALFADRFRARTDVYAVRWKTLVRVHPGGHQPSPAAGAKAWTGATPLIFLARRKSWRLISSATFSWAPTRCYVHDVAGGMDIDLHAPSRRAGGLDVRPPPVDGPKLNWLPSPPTNRLHPSRPVGFRRE
jgi:hypothetical protein